MARADITSQSIDLQSDNGAVLFSLIQGEQLAYQITLDWLLSVASFDFEAVVMEADNNGTGELPSVAKTGGVNTTLTVVKPVSSGNWNATTAYDYGVIVSRTIFGVLTSFQKKSYGVSINSTTPESDSVNWELYVNNKIILQFPSSLSSTYATQPTPNLPVFGFFELAISETGNAFNRTWKPMRGAIQFNYSPTKLV